MSGSIINLTGILRGGDSTAQRELLVRYAPWLKLLARMQIDTRFGGKFDGSDIAQQTLLEACRALPQFRGGTEAELTAWLRTILAHVLAHEIRKYRGAEQRNIDREVSLDQSLAASSNRLADVLAVTGSSPSRKAARHESELLLAETLQRLPADYREVIILRNLQGLSHDDVAATMNRSPGAVRMLWVRALAALKKNSKRFAIHGPVRNSNSVTNRFVLVLGSQNKKKRGELAELLDLPELELRTLADFPPVDNVDETGDSFMANAIIKAAAFARRLGQWVLADDSGLCVDALAGAPGIYSARYAGEPCDDQRNNDRLLAELAGVPPERRTAHFCCAAAVADPSGKVRAQAEGQCHGRIIEERRGGQGFGYDPLFLVPDCGLTYGELPAEYKRQYSHRAVALAKLRPQLLALVANTGR